MANFIVNLKQNEQIFFAEETEKFIKITNETKISMLPEKHM